MCGNKKCEPPYETCANCADDCGKCDNIGCLEVLTCALKCLESGVDGFPSPTCVATCVSRGCADVQYFFDQAFTCAVKAFPKCGGGGGGGGTGGTLDCLQKQCDKEFAACIGARCPT